MRGFRTAVAFLLVSGCLAVVVPGAAQGGPGATAKTVFQVSLPDSGQVMLTKLTLMVKAKPGKAVPKRISLKLGLQGTLASSAAVIAGPAKVAKLSRGKAQVTAYVAIVNKRGASAARILAGRRALRSSTTVPFLFLTGPAAPATVPAKTATALTISAGLRVGSCPGCKPLSEAAKRTACANNLKQIGLALHTLGGQNALGGVSPQNAWGSWWSFGCGQVSTQYLLPYIETTGKDPHCAFHIGFGTGPFADDNQLALTCPVTVSSFALLAPSDSWGTPVNRWSNWAVVGPGVFNGGPCQKTWQTDQPALGEPAFSCIVNPPLVGGSGQQLFVAFGPAQIAGTQFVAGLIDPNGLDWYQVGAVGK